MQKTFYLTTTLPYVNSDPHIGFALEIIQADALCRYKKLQGFDVIFNTGTDEHGLKIYQEALKQKKDPQAYCNEYAKKFDRLKSGLNLSYTNFVRTTDDYHVKAAQEFWKRCYKNGDIYKQNYKIRYCVGCELEKTDSELVDGRCPLHPKQEIQTYQEENYFFKFSKYQKNLLELYENNPSFVMPSFRLNEIKEFVSKGLQDFSVSRLKKKMPWGVDVPGDPEHVMYVWFDALINYISTIGWPTDEKRFNQFWPGTQVAGKDNLRQQSAMWQAMLMSACLKNSKQIFIHGFITSEGKKMSKSLGNVTNPFKLAKQYGIDAVRYYLLKEIPPFEDSDLSHKRMKEVYNSDLANELGNLVLRITTLAETDGLSFQPISNYQFNNLTIKQFESFQFNIILENIWKEIKTLNRKTDEFAPWKKSKPERQQFLLSSLESIQSIAFQLLPFLPQTADTIQKATQGKIKKIPPLFPKI
jgi:methionyl-tRNA synthetase